MSTTYYILSGNEWIRCKTAEESKAGWLHFRLSDGTRGCRRPGEWRKQTQ